ncbi:hypothetical protein OKC48_16220 [Methylorubrum extorquens]|uniref:hypothetical protein n=1 Tax=Methylorubrum extorquens TaxID=408 RepID=UPI00223902F8|nr:hypothetical protein [Methylorubrum extorquens]UYW24819.1 hypothetical protein OKC48_16220 [Methylorubrum extorquens]
MSSSSAPTPEAPPPPRVVTDAEVVILLRAAVAQPGSQRAFVKAVGVNEGDLSSTLRGRRPPSTALRRAVGVETRLVHVGAAR